jgi:hypothetical protein
VPVAGLGHCDSGSEEPERGDQAAHQ